MEIKIREKSFKIAWEFFVAPMLLLLAVAILAVTNYPALRQYPVSILNHEEKAPVNNSANTSSKVTITPDASQADGNSDEENPRDKQEKEVAEKIVQPGKVDINRAGMDELLTLPFIGEVKAKAILDYRKEHGSFNSPEELENVKGIGKKTLEKLKPFITIQ